MFDTTRFGSYSSFDPRRWYSSETDDRIGPGLLVSQIDGSWTVWTFRRPMAPSALRTGKVVVDVQGPMMFDHLKIIAVQVALGIWVVPFAHRAPWLL